jgi:C4-dicarboxylate-specific signal transduction histidine kinase
VNITELIEDVLRLTGSGFERHGIKTAMEFDTRLPEISVDRHKVLQILINLIRNAKQACKNSPQPDKQLTVRARASDSRLSISVIDNGVGIPKENLTRIFAHGFTTRQNGHGFGLHSSALAAKELGGKLLVCSDGPGRGAMFTLELNLNRNN